MNCKMNKILLILSLGSAYLSYNRSEIFSLELQINFNRFSFWDIINISNSNYSTSFENYDVNVFAELHENVYDLEDCRDERRMNLNFTKSEVAVQLKSYNQSYPMFRQLSVTLLRNKTESRGTNDILFNLFIILTNLNQSLDSTISDTRSTSISTLIYSKLYPSSINYEDPNSSNSVVQLFEILIVHGQRIVNAVSLTSDFDEYSLTFPMRRRMNFHGVLIPVLAYEAEFVTGTDDPETGIITGQRVAESTLRDMQFMSNFRVNVTTSDASPTDPDYFGKAKQELESRRAVLAIGYFYVLISRVNMTPVVPLVPLMSDGVFAFFTQPESSSVRNIYVVPLQRNLLLVFLIIMLTVGTLAVVSVKVKAKHLNYRDKVHLDFLDAAVLAISLISQKEYRLCNHIQHYAHFQLFRKLTLCGGLLSLLTYLLFSTNLLSVILQPIYPVTNKQDLINYGFTFNVIPSAEDLIFGNESEYDLKRQLHLNNSKKSYQESIQAVFYEKHAHIDVTFGSINGLSWTIGVLVHVKEPHKEICEKLSSVRFLNSNIFFASSFFVRKKSPFRGLFNRHILRIKGSGLLHRYFKHKPTKQENDTEWLSCDSLSMKLGYQDDLGIEDVFSAFVLMFASFLLSLAIFIAECVRQFYMNNIMISRPTQALNRNVLLRK